METIGQHSLHDELLGRIKRMIIDGQFLPGDKIPERELCERFGVSRTPLREALKVLAAEGLLTLAPNRGAVVTTISEQEIQECVPISEAIAGLSGELACDAVTDDQIQEIKTLHRAMVEQYAAGDREGFVQLSQQIHEKIVAATGNELLSTIYDIVFFRIGWKRLMAQLPDDTVQLAIADERNIVLALEARDGRRLGELLTIFLERVFDAHRMAVQRLPH